MLNCKSLTVFHWLSPVLLYVWLLSQRTSFLMMHVLFCSLTQSREDAEKICRLQIVSQFILFVKSIMIINMMDVTCYKAKV